MQIFKKFRPFLFLLILGLMEGMFQPVWAISDEGPKGKIAGRVLDKGSGEALIGVSVMIQGTTKGAITDLDGNYTINFLEDGTFSLIFRILSYRTETITNIKVENGKTVHVDLAMEIMGNEISEAKVEAKAVENTVSKIILLQQKSPNLVAGISQEDIKKSPDRNVGDVLKRVSGASLQDNKFAVIRGLADRYNTAMANGLPIPTAEPDRKAFSFDIFPSFLIDNLMISKTATPELPGDFAGGVIQLSTKDIPEEGFFSVQVSQGYNSLSTFQKSLSGPKGKTDWLGMDDGSRNLSSDFPTQDEINNPPNPGDENYQVAKELPNDWGISTKKSTPTNSGLQFAGGTNLFENRLGIMAALTYNSTYKANQLQRQDFDSDTTRLFLTRDVQYENQILWGGLLNIAYKLTPNHKISVKSFYNVIGANGVTDREGTNFSLDRYEKANSIEFQSTRLLSSQLQGDHYLPKFGKIKINWAGSYNQTKKDVPAQRRMFSVKNLTPLGTVADTTFIAFVPFGSAQPLYGGRFYADLTEEMMAGSLGISIPFNLVKATSSVKAGGFFQGREREFDARVMGFRVSDFQKFDNSYLFLPQEEIFSPDHMGVNGFELNEISSPSDNYNAGSNLIAGYAMADLNIYKFRAIFGARAEQFQLDLFSRKFGGDTISLDTTYLDILPSVNLIYSITPKVNVKAAYFQTVSRPEFRELAPFMYLDFATFSAATGTDTLLRTQIQNFDFRVDYFPGMNQMIGVGAFYKEFTNPIEATMSSSGFGSRFKSYQNVPKAVSYGLEFEFRTKLGYLDSLIGRKIFGNITWFSNASYIFSEVDLSNVATLDTSQKTRSMQGQSPYLINTGISYLADKPGLNISLLYNVIGRRISDVGMNGYLDIFEAPRNVLDFQVAKRFMKNGEFKFTLGNILNAPFRFYQDENKSGKFEEPVDKLITRIHVGINASISIAYKF